MELGKAGVAEPPAAATGWSCLAGSEEGWTGLPGMVSPHARSRSSSPGEEESCSVAVTRLLPELATGVPAELRIAFFWSHLVTEGHSP